MTREEWRRIKQLAGEALDLPENERDAFVLSAASGDEALQREVKSLVFFSGRASGLFESPAFITRTTLQVGARLGPYQIVGLIGAGGMGEVYRARDDRIGRDVAIKVLPLVLSVDRERVRRFEHEARAAGVLNHPNVVIVLDVGSYEGTPYVVTELLEGETLRDRLARPIPAQVAVTFARQIAEGLAAAHEKGIVHRDLKPENLFVTRDDRIKILDFGLAKLMRDDGTPGEGTTPGMVMGTAGYMAPEQVRGQLTDHRSDLFALGAILYEMLSGKRAFEAQSAVETMNAIVATQPDKLSIVVPNISEDLERIVERALEKDPGRRFQSARDFARELAETIPLAGSATSSRSGKTRAAASRGRRSTLYAATAAAIVAVAIAGFFIANRNRTPAIIPRDSIVIGEITNSTGEAVFDDVLKQALLIQLEPSPFLDIAPEATVRQALQMMGRPPDAHLTPELVREVCQREGAKATLTGSLALLGSRYIVNLNASDCATGGALIREQESTDRREEVVAALARACSRLRSKLGESLSSVQRYDAPAERATTTSLEALRNFSLAVAARARGADTQAIALFNRALELDPTFPAAHIRLSAIYSVAGEFELSARHARSAYDRRETTGERERLLIEHAYYKRVTGELDKAMSTLEAWSQLYPRDFDPHLQLSSIYSQTGDYQNAVKEALEAKRLKGPAAQVAGALGRAYHGLNQFDEVRKLAVDPQRLSVAERTNQYGVDFIRGDVEAMERHLAALKGTLGEPFLRVWHAIGVSASGRFREAREQFRLTTEADQRFSLREGAATALALEAIGEAAAGNQEEARSYARASVKVLEGRQSGGVAATALALAGTADEAAAIDAHLSKAFPADTLLNEVFLACTRALNEASRGRPQDGLEILRRAAPYELGWTSYYLPSYVRGLLYLQLGDGRSAQAQFQNILDHQGILAVSPLYSLAHLQLARAAVLSKDNASAASSYDKFLAAWKDADAGNPLLARARDEYRQLTGGAPSSLQR